MRKKPPTYSKTSGFWLPISSQKPQLSELVIIQFTEVKNPDALDCFGRVIIAILRNLYRGGMSGKHTVLTYTSTSYVQNLDLADKKKFKINLTIAYFGKFLRL